MVALVRKSPAREPGRFSSSAMRWVIRACNLMEQTALSCRYLSSDRSCYSHSLLSKWDGGRGIPVLPLLQYLHWVESTGFLDGGNTVLLGVVRHHGSRLCRLTRGLGLWRHYRGGSRRNRRRSRRRPASRLRGDQLLRCVGGRCCIHHGAWREVRGGNEWII